MEEIYGILMQNQLWGIYSKEGVKDVEYLLEDEDYSTFVQPYNDALESIKVRIDALNQDYRRKNSNYPIHNIQSRIKKKESIFKKLEKRGLEVSFTGAKEFLTDIAGLRVICYFEEDVYAVESMIKRQSDIIVVKECDYIKEPKASGYKSYHLVVAIPVYYSDSTEYYPVEIQLRTISMDFWASMEHRICYKRDENNGRCTSGELVNYAKQLEDIEKQMRQLL